MGNSSGFQLKQDFIHENLRIILNRVWRGTCLCLYLMFILFSGLVTDVMSERRNHRTESRHVHTEDKYDLLQ